MSAATRRIRAERAIDVLVTIGGFTPIEVNALKDDQRIDEAVRVLSEGIQAMLARLRDVSIPQARAARELQIDAAAVSELADGGTSRLGFDSLREAYLQLRSFLARASQHLQPLTKARMPVQSELLGFAGHPDLAKMKGSEALDVLSHNIGVALGDRNETLRPFGPHVQGASAVYRRDGNWLLTAWICFGPPNEMTRIGRDELWHFENFLSTQDATSLRPIKPRSAY